MTEVLRSGGRSYDALSLDAIALPIRRLGRSAGLHPGAALAVDAFDPPMIAATLRLCRDEGWWLMPVDPRWPEAVRGRRVDRAGASAVVGPERLLPPPRASAPSPRRSPEGGVIVFTSGTTAGGRGVRLGWAQLDHAADAVNQHVRPAGAWLSPLPLAHVGALSVFIRTQRAGLPAWVEPKFYASAVASMLADARLSLVSLVGAQLAAVLDHLPQGLRRQRPLSAALLGGGPTDPTLVARAIDAGLPVATSYGLTECAAAATISAPGTRTTQSGEAGVALPHIQLHVDAAPGDEGPILLAGPSLFTHWDDGEAPPSGPYDTGDIGRIGPQGALIVLDRRADRIVTGGENVHPAEVEAVLDRCPDVIESCVVGEPDPRWGQRVTAVIRTRSGGVPTDLPALVETHLAPWQRPRRIVVWEEPLPRTATMKVQRAKVRERLGLGA